MRAIVLTVAALVAFANVGEAQATAYREVGGDITVRASQRTGIVKYRAFGVEPEIGLRLMLSNRSDEVIRVASSVVSRQLKMSGTQSGVDVPLDMRWLTDGHLATDSEVIWLTIQPGDSVSLPPHATLVWDFDVARADGLPFASGSYRFEVRFESLGEALRDERGQPWNGHWPEGRTTFELAFSRPTLPIEFAAMHLHRADDLMGRLRLDDALAEAQKAVAADPSFAEARLTLATLYVRAKRPGDAIPLFKKLLAEAPGEARASIGRALAYAHLVSGDAVNAAAVLRSAGMSERAISATLDEMRDIAEKPATEPSSLQLP